MKITHVWVYPYEKGSLKGFATVNFDDAFTVKGFKIVEGKKGYFVSMPSEVGADEMYYDTAYPTTKESHEELENAILDEYEALLKKEAEKKDESGSSRRRR